MSQKPIQSFKSLPKVKLGAEWKVFIWCFFIAIILWFLVSLNETYNSSIAVQVNYLNMPKGEVFVKPLPENIRVAVNAKGWDLLGYVLNAKSESVNIDLEQYRNQNYILSRRLRYDLQQQFAKDMFINELYPDTISLATDSKLTKRVPIELNLQTSFKEQYALGEAIDYSPDSVTVTGPASMVKGLNKVGTKEIILRNLDAPKDFDIQLKTPTTKNLTYSVGKINVKVPVYQLTEQVVEVPVEIINKNIEADIKLIPERATITYSTTLNNYQNITADMFEAVVDGSQIDTTNIVPLRIQIISQPDFTYNLRLKEEYVNYIINK